MVLLHVPSGRYVYIGKRMGWGWYAPPLEALVQKLYDMVESQEAAGDQDDFAVALEGDARVLLDNVVTLPQTPDPEHKKVIDKFMTSGMTDQERRKVINDFFKDEKGYEHRPMDKQDKLVLAACAVATVLLALVMCGGAT